MRSLVQVTATRVWAVLVLGTGVTAFIFETQGGSGWVTSAILVIAAIKIALIMNYFMEVSKGPRALKIACAVWLTAVLAIVLIGLAKP